jgi:probable HAF family extracellular repeat protein
MRRRNRFTKEFFMPLRKSVLSLAVLLLASAPLALAQGTYTQIDYPGALNTTAWGIDTAGDIVGWYAYENDGPDYGFLLSGGVYTTVAYPGSSTNAYGINDKGQIVGSIFEPNVGFIYDIQTQAFTTFSHPGAFDTSAQAFNAAGIVVGQVEHATSEAGFELVGSTYRPIELPGASDIAVGGISASGEVVGYYYTTTGPFNFAFYNGKYRQIVIPNATSAAVEGINPAGTALVGGYRPSVGMGYGFVYQNSTLTTLQFPGSSYTTATGINGVGEVVGVFQNANGVQHGFTWTPPADAGKK